MEKGYKLIKTNSDLAYNKIQAKGKSFGEYYQAIEQASSSGDIKRLVLISEDIDKWTEEVAEF